MIGLRCIFFANVIVAGYISLTSLFSPKVAQSIIFEGAFKYSEAIRLIGALWSAVFILSCVGVIFPLQMQMVLVFQVLYKLTWLLCVAVPSVIKNQSYPKSMAVFFWVWVIVLPFVIKWTLIF